MRGPAAIISVIAALALLPGCSNFSVEAGKPLKRVEGRLPVGETTYTEVMADMGPPHAVTPVGGGGFAFLYEHQDAQENQLTIAFAVLVSPFTEVGSAFSSAPAFFLSTIGPSIARAGGTSRVAVLIFDDDGTLRSAADEVREVDLGNQLAITWLVAPQAASDIGMLSEARLVHRWGKRNLNAIPTSLNELQSPDAGPYGFEQRGTPRGAGQRSNAQVRPLEFEEEERRRNGEFAED